MKKVLILFFLLYSGYSFAQDLAYTRKTLATLTSPDFWGRGYTKNGMAKTADFLEKEFKALGLTAVNKQQFTFPVNSFPNEMKLKINGRTLTPGKDFIVHPASTGLKGKGELIERDSLHFLAQEQKLILTFQPKLTWSVATKVEDFTEVYIQKGALKEVPKNFEIAIENEFIPQFKAANVCGLVKGTEHPDSILVVTAHYDHLGGMGKDVYFPGANDNASGVSLLLNLAKHYAKNPQSYTIAFICFAAEEAGLIGSKYFTEQPLFELSHIRFLLNLDLVGTGDTGATVVNATQYPSAFRLLNEINDENKFLSKINPRGKAANSDHYFFTEKGVPAFFLYTQGGISAYHDVDDKAVTLPLTAYENLYKLILKFNAALMKSAKMN
ncbi:M28 family metallopeptidase [Pedobacter insulae]|uniref:Peptidase family M28 n=1 Tax=Pedobacter insulae TaxID=414048 RepID=A0A1I2SY75_9SPHI|nr:M28 family peptidase [Pedobacter insulae]SFG55126.1 Peptidase family M28 [Pedobacter insulae]